MFGTPDANHYAAVNLPWRHSVNAAQVTLHDKIFTSPLSAGSQQGELPDCNMSTVIQENHQVSIIAEILLLPSNLPCQETWLHVDRP
jgi:hypothetical protein